MSHPGRVGVECRDCRAEMQESGNGLRCPWAKAPFQVEAGFVFCGRPFDRARGDALAAEYARDQTNRAIRP